MNVLPKPPHPPPPSSIPTFVTLLYLNPHVYFRFLFNLKLPEHSEGFQPWSSLSSPYRHQNLRYSFIQFCYSPVTSVPSMSVFCWVPTLKPFMINYPSVSFFLGVLRTLSIFFYPLYVLLKVPPKLVTMVYVFSPDLVLCHQYVTTSFM